MNLLTVKDVGVRFGGVHALDDVSIDVVEGEILALIGPNGAGKSTLFEVISGFLPTAAGSVELDGVSILGRRPPDINRMGIARSFQIMRLFLDMTALENTLVGGLVDTGSIAKARHRAEEMLALVGLTDKRDALASTLSTGQRKRLEMARAMATGPRVLLLDEVFGGVDAQASAELADSVRAVNGTGTTVVVIDHNLELLVALAHRMVCLHLGQVIAAGPPDEVATCDAVTEAYLR